MTANNDGWIEWHGGECPVDGYIKVDVKLRNGDSYGGDSAYFYSWDHDGAVDDIIAYRLHKQEDKVAAKPECTVIDPEPTIEQLAADYLNLRDFAERKQQEANDAKDDADAKLKALELACEAL